MDAGFWTDLKRHHRLPIESLPQRFMRQRPQELVEPADLFRLQGADEVYPNASLSIRSSPTRTR